MQAITAVMLTVLMAAGCTGSAAAPSVRGSGGKPSAPIDIRFSAPNKLAAGTPITLTVDVVSAADGDELQLQWLPSAGLTLGETPNPARISTPAKGRVYRQTLTLMASLDGEYFLGVMATLRMGASAQTLTRSTRLNIGVVAAKSKPALSIDSQDTLIEAMPAQESVPK